MKHRKFKRKLTALLKIILLLSGLTARDVYAKENGLDILNKR